jgi:hypothetical protein
MNDEQFEREVREAARRIADHRAPWTLHSQVAAIPAEHPHRARPGRRFGGSLRLAIAASALVAVVVATTFFVGALPRFNAVLPGGSPSGSPTAGPTPTSLGPSLTPAPSTAPSPTPASRFSATGSMAIGRFGHSATLLLDGRVLVVGGQDATGGESDSAELYDPATGTFSPTGSMVYPHISPAAILLRDGRVLVTGGPLGTVLKRDHSAELYDPSTGKFSLTGSMKVARSGQGTALLPDGRVLFAGGATTLLATYQGNYVPGADIVLASAELYDPITGQFSMTGSMTTAREDPTATLLPDGRVLIAGGSVQASSDGWKPTASAELYNPKTGKFTATGTMTTARSGDTATLLHDGRVLIAGGFGSDGNVLASVELYDPQTGSFSPTGSMATVRGDHTATLLPDGRVLIAGGADAPDDGLAANILASAELYDPKTGTFSPAGSMATARQLQTATLLLDGRVLIAGGADGLTPGPGNVTALALPSAELYQP